MRPIVFAVAAAAAACTAVPETGTSAAPVVGADLDLDDPGVVALVTSSGRVFCTGTLVSPMTVLTAAHCIAEANGDPAVAAFFGNDTGAPGARIGVDGYQTHPGWTGDLSGGHDLAVLRLVVPQPLALVKPMNTTDLAAYVGADYRVVGFGIHDRDTRELDGKKRVGHMRIARLDGDYLEAEDVDPDQATAICQGDSGGPGFITVDGVEVLAGTHSYSIVGCFNPSGDARPDLYMTTFIQPYIDANDLTCRADGQCVRLGCSNDPDCLPCGPDGTCATDCPLPDPDCPTSALGEICRADTQCMTGVCVAWPGDPHSRFCSQPCAGPADCPVTGMTCADVAGEGLICTYAGEPPGALGQACAAPTECSAYVCADGLCTYPCDVPRGLTCPTSYTCGSRDMGASYNCFPDDTGGGDDGGCCSSSGGPGSLAAGATVLGLLRRRRRR
ncbi:MAG: S1 family peptidase [Myxococcales bacterium]|nr:S1 family peptidase [Myxococcales bacterium]